MTACGRGISLRGSRADQEKHRFSPPEATKEQSNPVPKHWPGALDPDRDGASAVRDPGDGRGQGEYTGARLLGQHDSPSLPRAFRHPMRGQSFRAGALALS